MFQMKHTLWNISLKSVLKTPTQALTLPWELSKLSFPTEKQWYPELEFCTKDPRARSG